MKPTWKRSLTATALSLSLVLSAAPAAVWADGTEQVVQENTAYQLTEQLRAELKSIANTQTGEQLQIGAVIRLTNDGARVTRVPDYDVRVTTEAGITYTLRPSAANVKAVQAKEKVELSYMMTMESTEAAKLKELSWIDVNEYVYPKEETAVLTIPVGDAAWGGSDATIEDEAATKQWGETFQLPVLSKTLQFTPVTVINEKTEKGPVTVVTLLVENKGDKTETVPDFRIDGKSEIRAYEGQRVEQQVEVKPGETKYIHYGILTENNVKLNSLNVLTPETFVELGPDGKPAVVSYTVGRLHVQLPDREPFSAASLPLYTTGERIAFDPLNKLIDKDMHISMMDLSMNESESAGYKTVVAKFLVRNTGEKTMPLPSFQTELVNEEGFNYFGTRQLSNVEQLAPNLSYVINYSFAVPSSEDGEGLVMKILDNVTVAPFHIPISGYRVQIVPFEADNDVMSFYPFEAKLNYWNVSAQGANGSYYYKLKLDLDIKQIDNVVADPNTSNMKIEVVDTLGRLIGSQTMSFIGQDRLISGPQNIMIQNMRTEQFEWPLTVHVYEAIQTPNGEAKRLIKTLKQ